MNIHEYQAKGLLRNYGAPVADGRIVVKSEDAKTAAGELDGPVWVVKAQIHAGGRGKGTFKEKDAGGNGVKVIGYANVPGRVAKDASALYAKNIFNFLNLIINKEDKKINLNWEDEIVNAVVLTNDGKLRLEQFN